MLKPIPAALRHVREVRLAPPGLARRVGLFVVLGPLTMAPSTVTTLSFALVWGLVAMSLVVLTGWGGNISLGQFGIVGIGRSPATSSTSGRRPVRRRRRVHGDRAAVAVAIGLPALRIRGLYLAVTTITFAVALDSYFLNPANFSSFVPDSTLPPVLFKRYDMASQWVRYYFCLALVGLAALMVRALRRTRPGRVMIATRDNERAAGSFAVPTTWVKLQTFVFSGALAGLAGALYVVVLMPVGAGQGTFPRGVVDRGVLVRGDRRPDLDRRRDVRRHVLPAPRLRAGQAVLRRGGHDHPATRCRGRACSWILYFLPGGLWQFVQRQRDKYLGGSPTATASRCRAWWPTAGSTTSPSARTTPRTRPRSSWGRCHEPRCQARQRQRRPTGASRSSPSAASTPAYGPVQILFGLDLDIHEGEIVALLGTNGAGKSTLFKCITNLLEPTAGSVQFAGQDITRMPTDEIAARGRRDDAGRQERVPHAHRAGEPRLACWLKRKDPAAVREAEERVLDLFPRLADRIDQLAGNLSGGEQQMLAVSQALIPDPKLLLIDELSLGLAPTVVGQLIDVVRQIHATGLTVVVVEQSINVALQLADRAVFMEKGEFRFTGSTQDLLDRPDILRSVFIAGASAGEATAEAEPKRRRRTKAKVAAAPEAPARRPAPGPDAPVALSVPGIVKRFGGINAVNYVDLELREGEILGLIGQNGAGKTTLFDCISGFLPTDEGVVRLGDEDITTCRPTAAPPLASAARSRRPGSSRRSPPRRPSPSPASGTCSAGASSPPRSASPCRRRARPTSTRPSTSSST